MADIDIIKEKLELIEKLNKEKTLNIDHIDRLKLGKFNGNIIFTYNERNKYIDIKIPKLLNDLYDGLTLEDAMEILKNSNFASILTINPGAGKQLVEINNIVAYQTIKNNKYKYLKYKTKYLKLIT